MVKRSCGGACEEKRRWRKQRSKLLSGFEEERERVTEREVKKEKKTSQEKRKGHNITRVFS